MLYLYRLNGEVKCAQDATATCVLDGESSRRGMYVKRTNGGKLTIKSVTFDNCQASMGAGINIREGAIVDIKLCISSNCRATSSNIGGGAILISSTGGIVNVYGTSFNENIADSEEGKDIYRNGGTITIYNMCPTPYEDNTPVQGKKYVS